MLLAILQMDDINMDDIFFIIMIGVCAVGGILLLKLGLVITKATKRRRMKWVAGSFAIQFGVVFAISSPLFLLGIMGDYHGEPQGLVPIIIISAFIDFNVINILHQIGLKRSLVVLLLTFVPIFFAMVFFGVTISSYFY
jgi:hypothetical protein